MTKNNYHHSLIATASTTNKKSGNQDAVGEFEGNHFNSLFLADGLGSYLHAKQAANFLVDAFKAQDQQLDLADPLDLCTGLRDTFRVSKEQLITYSNAPEFSHTLGQENRFASTAIKICEHHDKIFIAYTGNGAIWHIRGNFTEFAAGYHFPWNAINYLNPHTSPEQGREVLYRLISDSNDFNESIPTILVIDKDKEYGDIIMVCTDGIYSADQVRAGQNEKGIWIKMDTPMLRFFEWLNDYFTNTTTYDKPGLKSALEQYLQHIQPLLNDDASIGMLATMEVLNFQYAQNKRLHAIH